jgi:uncharacterized membrane protein YgcG
MSSDLTLLDKSTMIEEYFTNLKDQRTFYIMDRVVVIQLTLLFITGIITSLTLIVGIQHIITDNWYLYLFVFPIIIISISILKWKKLGPSKTWKEAIIPNIFLWSVLTISLGVIFDVIFGFGTTFWVSFFMALYYSIGYIIAKKIRRSRFRIPKKYWMISMLTICILFCLVPLISGINSLFEIVKKYNIKSFFLHDYGEFLNCFPCALSIFYMISGIGIMLSMLLNYGAFTQLSLITVKSNVIYKPPSKLIYNYLMGTSITLFIFWIFLELLIPPIIGGGGNGSSSGGGGGGGSGGSGSSKRILDNSFVYEMDRTNEIWNNYVIPTVYIPLIIKLIEKEQLALKKKLESSKKEYKNYYIQHSPGYKTDYSPKGKH